MDWQLARRWLIHVNSMWIVYLPMVRWFGSPLFPIKVNIFIDTKVRMRLDGTPRGESFVVLRGQVLYGELDVTDGRVRI